MNVRQKAITAILALIAVMTIAAGVMVILSGRAGAGIGPGGYAQIAQDALKSPAAGFGYTVRCHGRYTNYALATVQVTCTLTQPVP